MKPIRWLARAVLNVLLAVLSYESPWDRLTLEQQKDARWKGGVGR